MAEQRLPIVNTDDGTWGDIIRQYIMKEHFNDDTDNPINGSHKAVNIRPGTAAAGTAPLKFLSGTLLASPEVGAIEFNTDTFYATTTTGPTRKKFAIYDDTNGTTGDMYYRDGAGSFTRLAIGSAAQILSISGGVPAWINPPQPGGVSGTVQYNNSGSFGGASKVGINANGSLELSEEPSPAVPTSGKVGLFGRTIAGRMLPSSIDSSGLDSALQPLLARNNVGYWNPPGNATTVPGVFGFTAPTVVGTTTLRNVAVTNGATRMRRLGYVSAATIGSIAEARVAVAQFTCGSGINDGSGFFLLVRFVPSNAAAVAGERFFIGMRSLTTAATNVQPNTLTGTIGLAQLSTDNTQFYIVYGGTTAQTAIACGTAIGSPASLSTQAFELAIYAPNAVANTYYIQVTNIFTNVSFTTTLSGSAVQVPQSTTLLAYRAWKTNNTTAAAVGFDICSIYIETDM